MRGCQESGSSEDIDRADVLMVSQGSLRRADNPLPSTGPDGLGAELPSWRESGNVSTSMPTAVGNRSTPRHLR